MQKKNITRILTIVILILLIPLFGNIFVDGWNWGVFDFIFMGALLFVTGLAIDFVARKIANRTYRVIVIIAIVLVLIALWTELAVDAVSTAIKAMI